MQPGPREWLAVTEPVLMIQESFISWVDVLGWDGKRRKVRYLAQLLRCREQEGRSPSLRLG
jgi:hypothetical protein